MFNISNITTNYGNTTADDFIFNDNEIKIFSLILAIVVITVIGTLVYLERKRNHSKMYALADVEMTEANAGITEAKIEDGGYDFELATDNLCSKVNDNENFSI